MLARNRRVATHHGDYVPIPDAKEIGPADPDEQIKVTLVVGPRRPLPKLHTDRKLATRLPRDRHYLSREDFELHHGAHPDQLAQVENFARSHGFEIVEVAAARHGVVLRGRAGDFSNAFRVEMLEYHREMDGRGTDGRRGQAAEEVRPGRSGRSTDVLVR